MKRRMKRYQANKDLYDARKKFEEAKNISKVTNRQLEKLNDEKSKDELKQKAKIYLLWAINLAQSQYRFMKSNLEI